MNLLAKFSLIFLLVFALGLTVVGYFARGFLYANAREQVHKQAKIMMDTALAVRQYTTTNIKPILSSAETQDSKFHRESVPAFSATEVFLNLRKTNADYAEYSYKEAVLNPTNPRDQARGWEEDIVNGFRNHPDRKQVRGQRETPTGDSLFLAQPLVVGTKEQCLGCHDKRDDAPAGMIKEYSLGGTVNGFAWKAGEIIGAQIVSVPVSKAVNVADSAFRHLMVWLVGGGLATLAILDAVLFFAVIRPIKRLARNADAISKGHMEIPELPPDGAREISVLAAAFNRMHRSLAKAMKLIDEQ
jgi:HAMP domain-containing protein